MAHEERALSYLNAHREELFSLLSRLIRFDSQNFITDGREAACAAYIEELYRSLGLETERYFPDELPGIKEHPGYLPGRGTDHRPNVGGVWGGDGPGVMLAAHIDTMPAGDLSKWTADPFGGIIRDGRIIGLGAGDNKAGIAAAYLAVKALIHCGISPCPAAPTSRTSTWNAGSFWSTPRRSRCFCCAAAARGEVNMIKEGFV